MTIHSNVLGGLTYDIDLSGNDYLVASSGGESLCGGAGDDTLVSGRGNDVLDGGDGNDTASYDSARCGVTVNLSLGGGQWTGAGCDTLISIENLIGSCHDDYLTGGAGNNLIEGGNGDDTLASAFSGDTLDGGCGWDTADYSGALGGVQVDLGAGTGVRIDGADTLVSIENVYGSSFGDVLAGADGQCNSLYGDDGNDTLMGTGDGDWLDGGCGIDTASYANATHAIDAELGFFKGRDFAPSGFEGDALVNIENITGSSFGDNLTGDCNDNVLDGSGGDDKLFGLGGNDTILGGDGNDTIAGGIGDDSIDGGAGVNTVSYSGAEGSVTVDLSAGTASGDLGDDTLANIQNVAGGIFDDTITGDINDNALTGDRGNDILSGGGGSDTLVGGVGSDTLNGGHGADVLTGGADADTFVFSSVGDVRSGQDVITDLDNTDTIDLSAMDCNGNKDGVQHFHIVDAFDGHKGEIVISYDADANQTLLSFDLNKDGVADASIAITGDHTDFSNFVF